MSFLLACKRMSEDKMHSGLTYKSDNGAIYVLMGYTDWPGIGREFYFVSENGETTSTYYPPCEDQVICA